MNQVSEKEVRATRRAILAKGDMNDYWTCLNTQKIASVATFKKVSKGVIAFYNINMRIF